ncbi:hypothetical protein [Pseudomonas typographi]|uniref:hypothetical protein n=1 Tax=Pseudomonas typographi TaxID=2715964 RepID=UPI001EEE574C|nr:hypothetical protein [Pseudomonas typographi]
MMRPGRKTEKVFLYPYPVDFRKSINGLVALVELEIKGKRTGNTPCAGQPGIH